MYNNTLKERFLDFRLETDPEDIVSNWRVVFTKTEKYEKILEKDVSNFTFQEIIDMYKMWNVSSISSLSTRNSLLSTYAIWSIQQDLVTDGQNHFAEIDYNILQQQCLNVSGFKGSIVTKEEIYRWIEQLSSARDKFIILSIYEFGKGKNFNIQTMSRITDVTEEGLIFEGETYKISFKLREIIKECKQEKSFTSLNAKVEREIKLVDNGYIYKLNPNVFVDNEKTRGRNVYTRLARILKWLGTNRTVSANTIMYSGMIHWINEHAEKLGITGEDYVKNYFEEVSKQYGYDAKRKFAFLYRFNEFLVK